MACEDCKRGGSMICILAAQDGHLSCLIWARKVKQYPWHENACAWAASRGHLDCLMWARKNGCPWDEYTCAFAACSGQLDCLRWARKNECPWNERTCNCCTINNGRLDCLIWAREHRCPWDIWVCKFAKREGQKAVLKWIHRNGSPCDCMKEVYIAWDGWKDSEEDCAICLEVLDDSTVQFVKCRHRYHKECMDMMLKVSEKKAKGCSICDRGK